jgi:hypothetical protein
LTITQVFPFVHPCEQLPLYSPGGDVKTAAEHRVAAIGLDASLGLERYATQAMRDARPGGRQWYLGKPGCTSTDKTNAEANFGVPVACDEFPNWSMERGGPGASLKYIPATDNSLEGVNLGRFYSLCSDVTGANRVPFFVIPLPAAPRTVFECGD